MNKTGFCGIDCSKCELGNNVVSKTADNLKNMAEKYEISKWFQFIPVADNEKFKFEDLNKGLLWLAKYASCPGCQNGGGAPDCQIRICAKEKKFESCSSCDEINACKKLNFLESAYPDLRENLKKMKKNIKF